MNTGKTFRHGQILRIVADPSISNQEELRRRLAAQKMRVTQATLSRDLAELRIIKTQQGYKQAAALPVAGLTALRTLRTGGPLLGRRVLVTGASGGVGSFAVQLARIAGAKVTALVSGENRVAAAAALGASQVVTELSDDVGPFELAVDGVGGDVLVQAVHRLAPGGTLTAYGVAGGGTSTLAFYDFAPLSRMLAFFIYRTGEETFGEDLRVLAELVAARQLDPRLGLVRDWTDTAAAVDALRKRSVTGKVVLSRSASG